MSTESPSGALLDQVMRSTRLPSLPPVAMSIVELVQRPDVNIDEITRVISSDPALTTKILRTANSSLYARRKNATRVRDAVMVLGFRNVKTLALGFTLVSGIRGKRGDSFDSNGFWQRSLLAASGAQAIAREARLREAEDAFLGGLIHGIGVLALLQAVGEEYLAMVQAAAGSFRRLLALEAEQYGLDHTVVGGELLSSWRLPDALAAAVRFQRTADLAPEAVRPIARAVATGISIADVATGGAPGESLAEYHLRCRTWFNLDRERADALLEEVLVNEAEMRSLFDVPRTAGWDVDEILARANDALVQLSLEMNQENERLHTVASELAEEASTDALTGTANRRAFDHQLALHFDTARRFGTPVTLVMADIDHFKRVNDDFGHQVGDRVLELVAEGLRSGLRRGDVLARYGGEEFAILLPGTGLHAACEVGERIRTEVEKLRLAVADGSIGVTISLGVTEIGGWHASPDAVVADADRALYSAKHAGRNQLAVTWGATKAA